MNQFLRMTCLAAVAVFALSACGPSEADKQKAADEAAAAAAAAQAAILPKDANDKAAWQKYLVNVVQKNMQGVKSNHPYMYYVPPGDGPDQLDARTNQLESVRTSVQRGVLPGNMMAFGGPDSKLTADMVVEAFKSAQDGSFKGVVVLFDGAAADQDRVKEALAKSGAEYRFVEMK